MAISRFSDVVKKKRILFVDDEPGILASLASVLRRDRERWEMVFALGGEVALCAIRRSRFDAVISDMKMPGIDGATLLSLVKSESPATARIMLTGYADDESMGRVFPTLHQMLCKPCNVATLREAIERNLVTCGVPKK